MYHKATNHKILNTNRINILGTDIFPYIVGESAYPLCTWLIKPFPHSGTMRSNQRSFNYQVSRARIVTENAFGHLKAWWKRLSKQNDMEVTRVPQVILACCILHNVCEVHGDTFVSTWLDETSDDQPATVPYPSTSRNTSTQAAAIHDHLVQHMT